MSHDYQWEVLSENRIPQNNISEFKPRFGPVVTQRDDDGTAKKVKFQLLLDNSNSRVFLVGNFNNWQRRDEFELQKDDYGVFATIELGDLVKHRDEYKFLVEQNGQTYMFQDPAGVYFGHNSNTIFWDFEDPSAYRMQNGFINTFDRTTKIAQTDLPGLIVHFKHQQTGKMGHEVSKDEYFRFIADSGVIGELKRLGFNTIQFLPFAQSIDGDNWKFRYLVPFQYAIQKNWGSPDDFAYMIDKFHEAGIAVIGDFVLGHLPFKDFNVFGLSCDENGLQVWKRTDGYEVYMKEETNWGTMRIDFDSPHVRDFFIDSVLHFLCRYRIDGFRIDNVDGIIRFGVNGDGEERPCGRQFLIDVNKSIYSYNPAALVHYEAHYFYEDNAKMLVAPIGSEDRALGATCYNSSDLTYYFHTEYMFKTIDKISMWTFKDINEAKEWGKKNSTIADFHNHDAAAGLMEMRCTGAYAYDCMINKQEENHVHALGKIKVMEALINFACEGRTLDLIQTFLLQRGTFEHESSIWWHLTFNEVSKNSLNFKKAVNEIMDDPAFWPANVCNRKYLNVDDKNKVLVIERFCEESRYIIVINTSSWKHHDYKVGVTSESDFVCVLNSDEFKYAGFGMASYPEILKNQPSQNFELLNREFVVPVISPYGVLVFKEKRE